MEGINSKLLHLPSSPFSSTLNGVGGIRDGAAGTFSAMDDSGTFSAIDDSGCVRGVVDEVVVVVRGEVVEV